MCPSARRISLASHCIYTRVVAFTGHYVRQNVALLVGDKLFARKIDYLLRDVAVIHHLHVLLQQLFLMPVQSGHRSLEESCREASHVRYGAIEKELFDYGLLREYFAEPHRQLHIILEGFANDTYQVWDLSTNAGPERHRQRKCHDVLQNLVLIVGAGYASLSHDLQVDTPRRRVILIRLKAEAAEDFKTLVQELAIEDEPGQPEALVLLQYSLVDLWRDLDLAIDSVWESTSVEEVQGGTFIGAWRLVRQHHTIVVGKLVEPLLVDEAEAFVNENVGVLGFVPALVLNDLLHGRIVGILAYLRLPVLILTAKGLLWDLLWVKVCNMSVIELIPHAIPIVLTLFSVFDEGVVMAGLGRAIVDNHSLQLVLEVCVCDGSLHPESLVEAEIFGRHILLLHLIDKVLPADSLLAVRLHVKVSREGAVVVHFVLLHGIEVELKAFQLEEEYIGKVLDRASLQSISLNLAFLAEVCVISFEPFALDKRLEPLKDRLLVLDLQRYGHELLLTLTVVRASPADELIREVAIEQVLHDFLLLCALDQVLDSVDQHVEELVDVSLHHRVDR